MFLSREAVPSCAPSPWGRAAAPAKVQPAASARWKESRSWAEGRECKVPRVTAAPGPMAGGVWGWGREWEPGNPSPRALGTPGCCPSSPGCPKDQDMRGRKGSYRDSHTRVWSWWTEYPRTEGELSKQMKLTVHLHKGKRQSIFEV